MNLHQPHDNGRPRKKVRFYEDVADVFVLRSTQTIFTSSGFPAWTSVLQFSDRVDDLLLFLQFLLEFRSLRSLLCRELNLNGWGRCGSIGKRRSCKDGIRLDEHTIMSLARLTSTRG